MPAVATAVRPGTSHALKVVVEPDEDRWRAYYPPLEHLGAATWGYTREEALSNLGEVLGMVAVELRDEGRPIPVDEAGPGEPSVVVTL
jgi:predicted RNase H-like HicB family nuclease